MAKIHTVEWAPALLANPVTEIGLNGSWWGALGERGKRDDFQAEVEELIAAIQNTDSWIIRQLLRTNPELAEKLESVKSY